MSNPSDESTAAAAEAAPAAPPQPRTKRLVSLDAYRGFVMLAMASAGLGLAAAARNEEVLWAYADTSVDTAWRSLWNFLGFQFSHVPWIGCSFWDLIQPSFMFIVGVAMPFSYAARQARGQSEWTMFRHVLVRSFVLVALGIFLSSNWKPQTNFTFVNVLTQIGLGYPIVYLLMTRGRAVQWAGVTVILAGYWLCFALYPLPPADFDWAAVGIDENWRLLEGFAAHWNKNENFAAWVDRGWMNLWPRPEPFTHNNGGYQTLNFVPSMATMLFGVMAGQLLRSDREPQEKFKWLWISGAAALAIVLAVDHTMWPIAGLSEFTICPSVKRIWTPTFAVFSTGWTLWLLACFYWIIDIKGYQRWAFPMVVVGMNSITMYVMAQLMKPWISDTLTTHLGYLIGTAQEQEDGSVTYALFAGPYSSITEAASRLLVMWLICYWLYRQKIFIKI